MDSATPIRKPVNEWRRGDAPSAGKSLGGTTGQEGRVAH